MKRVIIVGGGVAGHLVAHELQHEAHVVLVDPRDHLEVPMAAPRLLIEPEGCEQALLSYGAFLPSVEHRAARATRIDPGSVLLEGGQTLEGDFVVIATGRAYSSPWIKPSTGTMESRRSELDALAASIGQAERVLVVGGGAVGIEVAGELGEAGIPTVLAHAGDHILPGIRPAARSAAQAHLDRLGVRVLLDTPAPGGPRDTGPGIIAGTPYDLAIWCTGGQPRVDALGPELASAVTTEGIRVLPTLQLPRCATTFAVGDVTALREPKLGRWAAKHAAVVVTNLRSMLRESRPLATYEATRDPSILVTLGRGAAVGAIGPLPQWAVSAIGTRVKGTDLLVGRYRRRVGLVDPPG